MPSGCVHRHINTIGHPEFREAARFSVGVKVGIPLAVFAHVIIIVKQGYQRQQEDRNSPAVLDGRTSYNARFAAILKVPQTKQGVH